MPGTIGRRDYSTVIGLKDEGWGSGSKRRSHQDSSDEECKARASQHLLLPSLDQRPRASPSITQVVA